MAATISTARGSRRAGIVGINVTPMVDVVLVLLVIMMVSATYVVSQSLKVNLPKSQSSDGSQATTAIVSIAPNGTLFFNGRPIEESALKNEFKAAATADRDVTLVVSADAASQHGAVVHILDLARREKITRFAIQVARGGE